MKDWSRALSALVWFGQLGLDLLMPLLLCMALCWWLTTRFAWSMAIYVPGILIGLGGGAVNFLRFAKLQDKRRSDRDRQSEKTQNKRRQGGSFNRHE